MKNSADSETFRSTISLICPVYNEADLIRTFFCAVRDELQNARFSYELIFVDDGSQDETWTEISNLTESNSNVRGIRLTRNFGKEAALVAGLSRATGRAHIPIDVDLQDPPETIHDLVAAWEGGSEHAVAKRVVRRDSFFRTALSKFYHHSMGWLTFGDSGEDVGDFRLIDEKVSTRFLQLTEKRRVNKQLFSLASPVTASIPYVRPAPARKGSARQSFLKLADLSVASVGGNTRRLAGWGVAIGLSSQILTMLLALVLVYLWWIKIIEIPGQATTLAVGVGIIGSQVFLASFIVLVLAEILEEVKNRPLFLVAEETGSPEARRENSKHTDSM